MNIEKTDKLIWETILNVWKNSFHIKEEFKTTRPAAGSRDCHGERFRS